MTLQPPRSTRPDTLLPYPTLFRSLFAQHGDDEVGVAFRQKVQVRLGTQQPPFAEYPAGADGGLGLDDVPTGAQRITLRIRSEEHTSELQSLMRISYAVFCLKKKNQLYDNRHNK